MKTDDLNNLIDLYFDGELGKGKEPFLFTLLAQNEEARNYFKQMNKLKMLVEDTEEDFPDELEKSILYRISNENNKSKYWLFENRLFAAASSALAVFFLILSIYFFSTINNYSDQIKLAGEQINHQNEVMNVLINSIPAEEVMPEFENTIIIKSKKM